MPQPQQQPLDWVETPPQLVARVVQGETLTQSQREALVAALRRNRRKQRKAARGAEVAMPPIRATLNLSQLITDAMRPRLRKVD